MDEFKTEVTVMNEIPPHPNLVAMIGVITSGDPLILVIA
jgi:hypothetical protein